MRTYGTLIYSEKNWLITCEPHVSIRLRRMFSQIGGWQKDGRFMMSDTLDNARDLAWFMERYPLAMNADTQSILQRRQQSHVEQTSLVDALLAGRIQPSPVELARPLREYQAVAAEIAYQKKRLLLADDVGLGKTSSAIGLIARPECRPALVVTLTHLPRQWQAEIGVVAPGLSTDIIRNGEVYDISAARRRGRGAQPGLFGIPDVTLISYSKLDKWAETLAPLMKAVVFDEIQELRHSGSKKYTAGRYIAQSAEYCLGLSATPFYNYGGEMHAVMEVVSPMQLGTYEEFKNEWCIGDYDKLKIKDPRAFGVYMREGGFMLRRTRKDVGRELPPISKIPQLVDSNASVVEEVRERCADLARKIVGGRESYRGEMMQAAEEFSMRLRQATGVAKAPYVAAFVRLLVEGGERVVLYGWHREVYDIWMRELRELKPVLYTGSESINQKQTAKDAFTNGDSQVMIISLRSGAGLDGLQHVCRTIVIGELDWSPGVLEQCIGRVARDGQDEPVAVYYMLSDIGADPIMTEVIGLKRQQIEGVRNHEDSLVEEMEVDDGYIRRLAQDYLGKFEEERVEVAHG